ncbi:MAG: F0F1 ATP synthase subunit A [Acidimicrobiales bacterium]
MLSGALQLPAALLAAAAVNITNQVTAKLFGYTIDLSTVWATWIAGAIVVGLGLAMARGATSGVPGKLQLFWETVVDQVSDRVETAIGPRARPVVPLAVTIFVFILVANLLEMVPSVLTSGSPELLPAPTANVNLDFAMAAFVIVLVHGASIKVRGLRGYLSHYVRPHWAMLPINIIEELAKPFTLPLRLFGNMFAGGVMLIMIAALLPIYVIPVPLIIWKLFDMGIGVIQAFIFALLTLIYFEMSMTTMEEGSH